MNDTRCPKCGKTNFWKYGYGIISKGTKHQKYRCKEPGCGHVWLKKETQEEN